MLGYNMLQWLCGKLPWEDTGDPEYIHFKKNGFMSNIPLFMLRCFPDLEAPAVLSQYFQHVASLDFDTAPDYAYCTKLLRQGIEDSGCVDDGELVFGDSPLLGATEENDQGNKRRATEDPENIAELRAHRQFSMEKIIPVNPKKQVKKRAALNRKQPILYKWCQIAYAEIHRFFARSVRTNKTFAGNS
jgi:hypothetical protein